MKMATGPKDALFLTALLSLCDNFIFLIFSICSFTVKMSSHACTLQLFWTFNISGCCGTWLWLFREISWGNTVLLFPFTQRQHCHYIKHKRNPCIPDWFRCWRRDDVEGNTSSRSAHNLQITRDETFKLSFKHCTKPSWSFSLVFDEH